MVDGAYVLYMSVNGELRAAPYDRKRHLAGRSVTLNAGVRSEALGDAQIDLAPNGTLVFAPGVNAVVGRIVRLRPGHAPEPLPTEAAAFQRYDLSRDGRWLAAAVQTADGQELRIYDLRDGQRSTLLQAEIIRHPLWSPAGDRLIVGMRDSTHYSLLSGTPGSGRRPDTLLTVESRASLPNVDPIDYSDEHTLLVQDWVSNVTRRFDPAVISPAVRYRRDGGAVHLARPRRQARRVAGRRRVGRHRHVSYPVAGPPLAGRRRRRRADLALLHRTPLSHRRRLVPGAHQPGDG